MFGQVVPTLRNVQIQWRYPRRSILCCSEQSIREQPSSQHLATAVALLLCLVLYPPCSSPLTCWSAETAVMVCYGRCIMHSECDRTFVDRSGGKACRYPRSEVVFQEIAQTLRLDCRHIPAMWSHRPTARASRFEALKQSDGRCRSVRSRSLHPILVVGLTHITGSTKVVQDLTIWHYAHRCVGHSQTGDILHRCDYLLQLVEKGRTGFRDNVRCRS